MNQCEGEPVAVRAVAPAAIEIFEYLVSRQRALDPDEIVDVEGVLEYQRRAACAARGHFRKVAYPAMLEARRAASTGKLHEIYGHAVQRYSSRTKKVRELVDEALGFRQTTSVLQQHGVPPNLIASILKVIDRSDAMLRVEGGDLVVRSHGHDRRIVNDASSALGINNLLGIVARNWPSNGRGLATPVLGLTRDDDLPDEVRWTEAMVSGAIFVEWFFDRDIRTLQDVGELPAIEGQQIGLVVTAVAIAVGILLELIAKCVDDPEVALVLRVIGMILNTSWMGHVIMGIPVEECRTDPATGARRCARI